MDQEMVGMILRCLASVINKSKEANAMGQMGFAFSDDVVSEFEATYLELFKEINTKLLPENMFVVIADAKQVEITHEGNVKMGTIYCACGIDTKFIKDCWVVKLRSNQKISVTGGGFLAP